MKLRIFLIVLMALTGTLDGAYSLAQEVSSTGETKLYAFNGFTDGAYPFAGLVADSHGVLYGTTGYGGDGTDNINQGHGTVFSLTPPAKGQSAWTETILYRFCSEPGCSDGFRPLAPLIIDSAGALYGTTNLGGNAACGGNGNGCGTAFKLTPRPKGQTVWTETVLHTFTGGEDGSYPYAGLVADDQGALYGTTTSGGSSGYGTVFMLAPPEKGETEWTETVLYQFCSMPGCVDGADPVGGVIRDDQGVLYGTTNGGGIGFGLNICAGFGGSCGTVFKLAPPQKGETEWAETVLYQFCSMPDCADGAIPQPQLIFDQRGTLFGTTFGGGNIGGLDGNAGNGVVFLLTVIAHGVG